MTTELSKSCSREIAKSATGWYIVYWRMCLLMMMLPHVQTGHGGKEVWPDSKLHCANTSSGTQVYFCTSFTFFPLSVKWWSIFYMCDLYVFPRRPWINHHPVNTWRGNNIIIAPKTTSQRRFGVVLTLLLRHVSAGRSFCPEWPIWAEFDQPDRHRRTSSKLCII